MFTVVSDNVVAFLNVPFAEANRLAKVERALGSKVVVRRTTQADIDANDARLITIEHILSQRTHSAVTSTGWVRNNVVYGATML